MRFYKIVAVPTDSRTLVVICAKASPVFEQDIAGLNLALKHHLQPTSIPD